MYITNAFNAQKALAMFVALAVVLWSFGLHNTLVRDAHAGDLSNFSDTLTDSDPNDVSNHTIQFTIPNGMQIGETFTITLPGAFGMGSILIGDVDLASSTVDQTLAGAAGAGTWGVTGFGGNTLTFETPTDLGVGSSTVMEVQIGTNATGGTNQITNPAAGSYEITVGGTMQDSGRTRVYIIDNVLVTATVDTSFTFVISGTSTGVTINGSPTTTVATTSPTSTPFGTLNAGTSVTLAQDLAVTTNAANGFVVTVEQDTNLESGTGADIDGFRNGAYDNTPLAWQAPSNNILDENTWGHWGLTSSDDLNGSEFATDLWVAASTTPRQVFEHNGPSDGVTSNIGTASVGLQTQITSLQEAGDDYNTQLTYIATPTF